MDLATIKDNIWVEKYRGKTLNDLILPTSVKRFFKTIIDKKELPNLLLVSNSPGTGKSTIARAICNDLDADVLHINTSKTGIDILRTDVEKFARGMSLTGNQKVVIFEEFDGATPALQEALRADIEQYTSCRFIMTANRITKIIEPLKSRVQEFNFSFTDVKSKQEMLPKIISRLQGILKHEGIEFKPETIEKLVATRYPDIRKMIQLLQQYSNSHNVINDDIFSFVELDEEFYEFIINHQLTKARKYLIDRDLNPEEIYRQLFDNLVPKLAKEKQAQVIITLAQYGYQNSFTVDKEINLTACLLEIMGAI